MEETPKKIKKENPLTDTLQAIVISLAISIFIYIFIATPNQIDGESDMPTFNNGELVLTNRTEQWLGSTSFGKSIGYDYVRGDMIVFQEPGKPDFIKRIIAVGNDTVSLKDGNVIINGKTIKEDYLDPSLKTYGATFLQDGETRTVPADSYFVMGDNRTNSEDSRYVEVGFVKRDYIKGKVIFRYWPFSRFGVIDTGKTEAL